MGGRGDAWFWDSPGRHRIGRATIRRILTKTYLVLVGCPHVLDDFLTLGLGNSTSFRQDLRKDGVDLTRHMRGIATNVEISLVGQQFADLLRSLLESVLNVDLLGALSGERSDDLKLVTKSLLVILKR